MGYRPPQVCLQGPAQPEVALEGSGARAARTWAARGGFDRGGAWAWHTHVWKRPGEEGLRPRTHVSGKGFGGVWQGLRPRTHMYTRGIVGV